MCGGSEVTKLSEGEFKKRIGIRCSQLFKTLYEYGEEALKDGSLNAKMYTEIMNQIVDEAKQD